jgi:hypothetical protein
MWTIANTFALTFGDNRYNTPHTMPSGGLLALLGYAKFVRGSYTLALLGYTKTIDRLSYSERQQCHQCLCVNKLHTPMFDWHFFKCRGYWRKYGNKCPQFCWLLMQISSMGQSLVQRSPTMGLIVCVITETLKGALCSKLGMTGKWMNECRSERINK